MMNGGTRRKGRPEGDGSLERERAANVLVGWIVELIIIAVCHNCHFSIENPKHRHLFRCEYFLELERILKFYHACFDQCTYGLRFPDSSPSEYCMKSSRVVSSLPHIVELNRKCLGISKDHQHVHAWGSCSVSVGSKSKSLNRAGVVGAHPRQLCSRWAKALNLGLSSGALPILL